MKYYNIRFPRTSRLFRMSPNHRSPPHSAPRLALLAIALSAPLAAWAQDPRHSSEPSDLDAVIVRASPLAKSAEDLTQPIEVLAGERLDEMKASSLGETVNRLPGIQSSYHGPGVGRPIIRGMDGARVQVPLPPDTVCTDLRYLRPLAGEGAL